MQPENVRRSQIVDGYIRPPTHLEVIAVDHCNITCAGCNHASPAMPAWFADPEAVHRDLSILARVYRPRFIKLLGGEPLMHRNLPALIDAIHCAGMECPISLVTNGMLLHRVPDAVWEGVDEIEFSLYPGAPGQEANVELARKRMAEMGKTLKVFRYEDFRATFTLRGTQDRDLVRRIYSACKVANFWGCHGLRDGHFYKCPQSMYAGHLVNGVVSGRDRVAISERPTLQEELLAFVNSSDPLDACSHCLGTVGIQEAHSLPPRGRWRESIDRPSEELVDYAWLEQSLIRFDEPDDCKVRQARAGILKALRTRLKRLFGKSSLRSGAGRRQRRIPIRPDEASALTPPAAPRDRPPGA